MIAPAADITLPTWGVQRDELSKTVTREERNAPLDQSRYVLRRFVAQGGFGEVWESVQTSLGRVVAVKKIQDRLYERAAGKPGERETLEQSFRQEASITAQLDHPNIVPVYDLGLDELGRPMLAMKLVRGRPWNEILREDYEPLTPDRFLQKHLPILLSMARAVAFAHSRGIVHRDLKPSQVMVGEFGEVLLMDWGLAVFVGTVAPEVSEPLPPHANIPTRDTASSPGGTPSLMAPEQTLNTAQFITPRTDIYLLGGTLYFLLSGFYPHAAENSTKALELARAGNILRPRERAPNRLIPEELENLAMACLEKEPDKRTRSVREFIASIEDYLSGASRRRESESLLKRVATRYQDLSSRIRQLDQPDAAPWVDRQGEWAYDGLSECLAEVERAGQLWPENPELARYRNLINGDFARVALDNDDLRLARTVARRLENGQAILHEVEVKELKLARDRRYRVYATALIGLLAMILIGLGVKYESDQRAARTRLEAERDEARSARSQAVAAEMEAVRQKLLAESASQTLEEELYFSSTNVALLSIDNRQFEKAREILFDKAPKRLRQWEWGYLLGRLQPESMALLTARQGFNATFSHDGRTISTGELDGMSLYDAATGRRLWHTRVGSKLIWNTRFSPDGRRIAGTSFDSHVYIVDAATGVLQLTLGKHNDRIVRDAAWTPDGGTLATSGADNKVRFWNTTTGEVAGIIDRFQYDIYTVEYSSDGRRLLTASLDNRATLWDVATGLPVREYQGHRENVLSAAFAQNETKVITASTDGSIRFFGTDSGGLLGTVPLGESYPHRAVASPDGKLLAVADDRGILSLIDMETTQTLAKVQVDDPMWKISFRPDGENIVTTSRRSIRVFNVNRQLRRWAYSTNPSVEEVGAADRRIRIYGAPPTRSTTWLARDSVWDASAGVTTINIGKESQAVLGRFCAVSPDRRWSVHLNRNLLSAQVREAGAAEPVLNLQDRRYIDAEFSPDGSLMVLSELMDLMHVYTTSDWKAKPHEIRIPLATGDVSNISTVRFNPKGTMLAVGIIGGRILLYETKGWGLVRELGGVDGAGLCVAWSPDGSILASGGSNDRIGLWEVGSGSLLHQMVGHQRTIFTLDFSPDGRRLVSAAGDYNVKLWDVASGREVLNLFRGNSSTEPLGVAFSSDGRRILVATDKPDFHVFEAFPWNEGDYPGDETTPFDLRIEWLKRRERMNVAIGREDVVLATSPPAATADTAGGK